MSRPNDQHRTLAWIFSGIFAAGALGVAAAHYISKEDFPYPASTHGQWDTAETYVFFACLAASLFFADGTLLLKFVQFWRKMNGKPPIEP